VAVAGQHDGQASWVTAEVIEARLTGQRVPHHGQVELKTLKGVCGAYDWSVGRTKPVCEIGFDKLTLVVTSNKDRDAVRLKRRPATTGGLRRDAVPSDDGGGGHRRDGMAYLGVSIVPRRVGRE
jgi:hypothetical protein